MAHHTNDCIIIIIIIIIKCFISRQRSYSIWNVYAVIFVTEVVSILPVLFVDTSRHLPYVTTIHILFIFICYVMLISCVNSGPLPSSGDCLEDKKLEYYQNCSFVLLLTPGGVLILIPCVVP